MTLNMLQYDSSYGTFASCRLRFFPIVVMRPVTLLWSLQRYVEQDFLHFLGFFSLGRKCPFFSHAHVI